jgi:hypothetical protein
MGEDFMPVFEKLRVSLAPRAESPLFADQEVAGRPRRDFLVAAFSDRRDFLPTRGSAKISFVPITAPDGYVAGFFGRQRRRKGHRGPDAAFSEMDQENWEISLFVMDLAHDSQIAWFQINSEVGSPKSLLESLFAHLLRNPSFSDYRALIKYMDSEGEYWAAVRANRDRITKLSFTFIPPNALNMRQKVADFVKTANEQGHSDTQTHVYRAEPGQMDPESEILAASADIAMGGGGEAEVKAGKQTVYDSKNHRTTREVDADEMPTPEKPTFVRRVIDRLFR